VKSSSKSGAPKARPGTTKIKGISYSKKRSAPVTRSNLKKATEKTAKTAIVASNRGGKDGEGKMVQTDLIGEPRKDKPMAYEPAGSEVNETRRSTEVPIASAIEKIEGRRDERASELVDRLSLWSGAAGFIPVPLVDIAAVWGVQFHMLRRLSDIYGVPFSENRGKSILSSLAGAIIPATTATTTGSVMKGVPIIGTAIGALTMPVVAAGATWVIGKVFIKHFASGGTLLDFNAPDYREFIKAQKAEFAARSRGAPPTPLSDTTPVTSDTATKSETTTAT